MSPTEDTRVHFSSREALSAELRALAGDFIVVEDVSPVHYSKLSEERSKLLPGLKFHYRAAEKTLYITAPSSPHEEAHRTLYLYMRDDMTSMGLPRKAWRERGSTTYKRDGGKDEGEGDSCGLPRDARDGAGWPTLVMEAGYSQSLGSLRRTMRWWFSASEHAVNIVLLVKLIGAEKKIVIEKYTEGAPRGRPGATATRSTPGLDPILRQEIEIAPVPGSVPASYTVASGALVLEFDLLFLRPADGSRGERDVRITVDGLQDLADQVWA